MHTLYSLWRTSLAGEGLSPTDMRVFEVCCGHKLSSSARSGVPQLVRHLVSAGSNKPRSLPIEGFLAAYVGSVGLQIPRLASEALTLISSRPSEALSSTSVKSDQILRSEFDSPRHATKWPAKDNQAEALPRKNAMRQNPYQCSEHVRERTQAMKEQVFRSSLHPGESASLGCKVSMVNRNRVWAD